MLYRLTLGTVCLMITTAVAYADVLWGVNGHPITAYPGISVERQLDFLRDLGAKSYRVNISDEGGADTLATLVAEGKERGIKILPVITPGTISLELDSTGELYQKSYDLAVALGSRFKDDIRVWELGNEMENYAIIMPCEKRDDGSQYPCEWGPAGGVDPSEYYGPRWAKVSAVLKGLSEGMISVDPGIQKAIGTAGWGHLGAFERMKQDGIEWDISVWHMYGQDPEWAFEKLSEYGRPIWVTELNLPYSSERSEREQAIGLRQAMMRLRELSAKYKVTAAHIYELLDEPYWAPSFEASMGLVRLNATAGGGWTTGGPKTAYFAVREFIRGPRKLPSMERKCDLAGGGATQSLPVQKASFVNCLVIGRTGDAETIARMAKELETGSVTIPDAVMHLILSREFDERYAAYAFTDRAYVAFLYRLLLNRDPDGYGLDAYTQQLATGEITREGIALGMVLSSEFQDRYREVLVDEATGSLSE